MADDGTEELLKHSVKEYLIKLVCVRPVLYSKSHKDFKHSRTIK